MALLNHAGDNCLGHDERRVQVHVNNLSELGSRHIAHGNPLDDAGIVHQNVHHAYFLLNLSNHLIDGVLTGHVTYIAVGFDSLFLVSSQSLVNQLLLDIIEHDGCACACHGLGDGKADSVGCTCNQGYLALQ